MGTPKIAQSCLVIALLLAGCTTPEPPTIPTKDYNLEGEAQTGNSNEYKNAELYMPNVQY